MSTNIAIHRLKDPFSFAEVLLTVHGEWGREPVTLAVLLYKVRYDQVMIYHYEISLLISIPICSAPAPYNSYSRTGYPLCYNGQRCKVTTFLPFEFLIWEHLVAPSPLRDLLWYIIFSDCRYDFAHMRILLGKWSELCSSVDDSNAHDFSILVQSNPMAKLLQSRSKDKVSLPLLQSFSLTAIFWDIGLQATMALRGQQRELPRKALNPKECAEI